MQTDFQLSDILVDYIHTDSVGDATSFKAGYGTDLFIFDLDNSTYKCAICCNIVSDLVIESNCCGALVCKTCIKFFEDKLEIDNVDLKCHACNTPRNSRISGTKNKLKDSALSSVHVLCRFCNENGNCEQGTISLGQLPHHFNSKPTGGGCQFYLRKCGIQDCTLQMNFAELNKHVSLCTGCKEYFHTIDESNHKTNKCKARLITCKHGCQQSFKPIDEKEHESMCPEKIYTYPNFDVNEIQFLCNNDFTRATFQNSTEIQAKNALWQVMKLHDSEKRQQSLIEKLYEKFGVLDQKYSELFMENSQLQKQLQVAQTSIQKLEEANISVINQLNKSMKKRRRSHIGNDGQNDENDIMDDDEQVNVSGPYSIMFENWKKLFKSSKKNMLSRLLNHENQDQNNRVVRIPFEIPYETVNAFQSDEFQINLLDTSDEIRLLKGCIECIRRDNLIFRLKLKSIDNLPIKIKFSFIIVDSHNNILNTRRYVNNGKLNYHYFSDGNDVARVILPSEYDNEMVLNNFVFHGIRSSSSSNSSSSSSSNIVIDAGSEFDDNNKKLRIILELEIVDYYVSLLQNWIEEAKEDRPYHVSFLATALKQLQLEPISRSYNLPFQMAIDDIDANGNYTTKSIDEFGFEIKKGELTYILNGHIELLSRTNSRDGLRFRVHLNYSGVIALKIVFYIFRTDVNDEVLTIKSHRSSDDGFQEFNSTKYKYLEVAVLNQVGLCIADKQAKEFIEMFTGNDRSPLRVICNISTR